MKKDIETRTDIELLVNSFYNKVIADSRLGYVFLQVAEVNWSTHLAVMYDFWENMILFTGTYEGNPMNLHKHLSQLSPLNQTHFDQWNKLFTETVDELFEGKKAVIAKQRTISISNIISQKVLEAQQNQ
ncbi:MAG: group III truncated hemoglobin [Ferruginibacter sp.]